MDDKDIQKLVELRKYTIDSYNNLDGRDSPASAVVKQVDVAHTLETIVASIDDLIKEHVSFQK